MMGFGGLGATWAVVCKVVVAVLVLAEYGGSGVWGQPSQAGWLNIDCGNPTKYTDPVTGINWVPDTPYITTGKAVTIIATAAFAESSTLRSFPDAHAKSCYSLPVTPSGSYILRATFFYAGYDNAPNPPSFNLAVDGTLFANVTGNRDIWIYREVLFVAPGGNVTMFCLLPDANTVPFISAISLKPYFGAYLGIDEYLVAKQLIVTEQRVNFGGDKFLRYPDDPIDRYWFRAEFNTSYLQAAAPLGVISTKEPIVVDNSYHVPQPVVQTGLQLPAPGNVTLMPLGGTLALPRVLKKVELCMHFSELDPTANVTSREFTINVPRPTGPQVLVENPYNFTKVPMPFTANTWYVWDMLDVGPATAINFSSSPTSVRGPIINGMEVFSILEPASNTVTATQDVLAIEAIKVDMNLTEWTGDPCVPVPHNWLNCTLNGQSKQHEVTYVGLSGYNLTGAISPSFAKLEALISLSLANNALTGPLPDLSTLTVIGTLQLENNMLTGPLPSWLASMTRLRKLSVQNNNFSGEIPPGLVGVNSLQFTYQPGNPNLIVGNATLSKFESSKPNIGIIVGATVGGLVGLVALVGLTVCCIYKSRNNAKKTENNTEPEGMSLPEIAGSKAFSFAQIAAFTNNFKRKIGSGGFGPVYYGRLPSGQEVAVKVADSSSHQGATEFHNEVELMSRVHHRNLVPLVGYCQEGANQILVYEYVDMGSLHDNLFGTSASRKVEAMNWNKRLNIAVNAAQGLEYLHTGCIPGIIHRDVKSSNILLTNKSEIAKVADFGVSKSTSDENATHVSTLVKGTCGYLDPEYFQSNCLTFKSDVYSFGVVLLELMTGQPPVTTTPSSKRAGNLVEWVRENLSAGDIDRILDPTVKASNPNLDSLWKVAEVSMKCVEPKGVHRPTMSEVVQELRAALASEPMNHVEFHSESSGNDVSVFFSGSQPSVR